MNAYTHKQVDVSITTQWHAEAHENSKADNFSANKHLWEHAQAAHKETHKFKHGGGAQINVNIEEL